MPFVRVKSAVKTDPQHEFSVSVDEFEANRDLYARVGKGTADEALPVVYVEPVKPRK
jgi:hypothetical protein